MFLVCHYNEIGLKGKNRKFFEEALIKNIKQGLIKSVPGSFKFVRRISGRIIVDLSDQGVDNKDKIERALKNIFGIAYFAFALKAEQEIDVIAEECLNLLSKEDFKSFRISSQRSKKDFALTSQEINEKIGALIVKKLNKKVDLKNYDLACYIEIVEKVAFIYCKKIKGPGGLPIGVSGRAVVLLSGGIDSPVASFYVFKRGIRGIFLHFHSSPYTSNDSIKKVKDLVKLLNKYQLKAKLYLTPFADIQKEILVNTPARLRIILYRRFMMRIAQEIAKKEKALAIITGEAIGQVASQTIENMGAIEEASKLPVLRPLVGFDKEEIIKKAKAIGTFNISILPHQDCCARFLPKHPATKAKLQDLKQAEKNLNIAKLIKAAVDATELEYVI